MATYPLESFDRVSITIYSITPESPPTAKYIYISLYASDFDVNTPEGLAAAAASDC